MSDILTEIGDELHALRKENARLREALARIVNVSDQPKTVERIAIEAVASINDES